MKKGYNEYSSLLKDIEYKTIRLEECKNIYGKGSRRYKDLKIEITSLKNQYDFYQEMGWLNE